MVFIRTLAVFDPGLAEQTRELKTFYPNSVLVTGPDIIFFWVARMMMLGLHFMKKVPFRTVFLTPIVTDANGDKMSKVKGNVIDPLDVVHGTTLDALLAKAEADGLSEAAMKTVRKLFPDGIPSAGVDALRFSLASMALPGRYLSLSVERIEGYRHFINKLWNASRFALMNLEDFEADRFADTLESGPPRDALSLADRWILSRLQRTAAEVDAALESFRFADAAGAIYHFIWGDLCDWYIELAKGSLYGAGEGADEVAVRRRTVAQGTLATTLEATLRMLHPFAPFVTEEIWQTLAARAESLDEGALIVAAYPRGESSYHDEAAEHRMAVLIRVVRTIRNIRAEWKVEPARFIEAHVAPLSSTALLGITQGVTVEMIQDLTPYIKALARVSVLHVAETADSIQRAQAATAPTEADDVYVVVPLTGLFDVAAERARLSKLIAGADAEAARIEAKLGDAGFRAKAPAAIVAKEQERLAAAQARVAALRASLAELGDA